MNKKTKEEWLFELFDDGKKPKEVAELTTYALKTCERYYTSWRRARSNKTLKVNESYEKAAKLFKKGLSQKEVRKKLERSSASVSGYYKRWKSEGGVIVQNNTSLLQEETNDSKNDNANDKQTSLSLKQVPENKTSYAEIDYEEHDNSEEDRSYLKSYFIGDIVFVTKNLTLPENDNGVLNANRPAVVVKSSNMSCHTVIVIYITKHIKRLDLTKHIKLTTSSLKYESMLVCDQIQTVSKKYINKVGELNKEDKLAIKQALIETFDLNKNVHSVQIKSFSTDLANYEIDENGDILVRVGNEMIILPSSKLKALGEEFLYIKENIIL